MAVADERWRLHELMTFLQVAAAAGFWQGSWQPVDQTRLAMILWTGPIAGRPTSPDGDEMVLVEDGEGVAEEAELRQCEQYTRPVIYPRAQELEKQAVRVFRRPETTD